MSNKAGGRSKQALVGRVLGIGSRAAAAITLTAALFTVGAEAAQAEARPVSSAATCTVPSGLVTTYVSGGLQRTYLIRVPNGAGPHTPMVMSIHGALGTAQGMQKVTGFTENSTPSPPDQAPVENMAAAEVSTMSSLGDREGFIAVFPQARADWGYVWDASPNSVDVQFVRELTEYLHRSGCSTSARTSVNGFSMGAMMSSRLMCVRPDLYSGAAMVGGVLNPLPECPIPPDKEILTVHGLRDSVVPFDGSLSANLAALAGPGSVSRVNRRDITLAWARAKDCPSPGWTTPGANEFTDLSCPRSSTAAVVGLDMGHTFDNPWLNTSKLIWASMRPERTCVYSPPGPPNPAMASAIVWGVALDIAFRVEFGRILREQMSCNPHVHDSLKRAIQADVRANPNGPIAQQIAFAMREQARLGLA